ncbi:MAG: DUF6249 domain-containing protein [Planctomycetota bacterium]|jgi:hypothetical protein
MDNETIIALCAILGSFCIPIAWFYFDSKSKERRARLMEKALEVGKPTEEIEQLLKAPDTPRKAAQVPYRKGLVLLAIGGAMLFAFSSGLGGHHDDDGMPIAGTILTFLGVAFLLSDFFNRGSRRGD